jgi:hypothetical protein
VSRFYQCCGIEFPEELGKYGCPNCNGDHVAKLKDHHMTKTQPPEGARMHYFRDEHDSRTVVMTILLANGQYRACVMESDEVRSYTVAFGDTRMAAIASLDDKIQAEG